MHADKDCRFLKNKYIFFVVENGIFSIVVSLEYGVAYFYSNYRSCL